MKILTIQPLSIVSRLEKGEIVYPNDDVILEKNDDSFISAYKWMVDKMDENCIKGKMTEFPFWGWYIYDNKKGSDILSCEDLDIKGYGKNSCVILLSLDDDEVLLSEFNLWHCVLNNGFCVNAKTESEFDKMYEWYENLTSKEMNEEKLKSWNNIFNIEPFENDFCSNGKYIQGTFWSINPNNVISIIRNT